MAFSSSHISALILEQLSRGEKRVLSLIVAIRKCLDPSDAFKGDLSVAVNAALRTLVASGAVVDTHGIYSLPPRK
jgi:hypothetical protein